MKINHFKYPWEAEHSPRLGLQDLDIPSSFGRGWHEVTGEGKKAFTLAEVLITLGIIGVVAAMTIPTLIQDYNTRVWNTSATVFNRKLEEALKTMNSQSTLAGYTTTERFVEELSKHFKTNKICQNDELLDCFSDIVYWGGGEATPEEVDMKIIKNAKNFGQKDWNTNIVGVQFANGTSAMIAYNPTTTCTQDPYSNQITGDNCLAILYDTSGAKNPNTSGKDLRANANVKKVGQGCMIELDGTCFTTTNFEVTPHTWNACESNHRSNDPEDIAYMTKYGIKYCLQESEGPDYWAGAVEACGGIDNLPSQAQILKITDYVYQKPTRMGFCSTDRHHDRFLELGLNFEKEYSGTSMFLWTNVNAGTLAQYIFLGGECLDYGISRNNARATAICIAN